MDYSMLSEALLEAESRAREAVRRREEEERWRKLAALPPVADEKEKKQMFDICVAYGLPPFPWMDKDEAAAIEVATRLKL